MRVDIEQVSSLSVYILLSAFSVPRSRTLRYREYEEDVHGLTVSHRIAEIHASSMKRLSKIEAADDPSDGAGEE